MDPQLKSILTSVALAIATAIASWAASHGLVPDQDQGTVANDLVTALFGAAAMGLAWYKSREHTPTAQIAAVNCAAVIPVCTVDPLYD
jgi:hypothetical protein